MEAVVIKSNPCPLWYEELEEYGGKEDPGESAVNRERMSQNQKREGMSVWGWLQREYEV